MQVRSAEIDKTRYSRGIRCAYTVRGEPNPVETPVVKDTLCPEFKHSHLVKINSVDADLLEYFNSGCITFSLYGRQEDAMADQRLAKMTTRVPKL